MSMHIVCTSNTTYLPHIKTRTNTRPQSDQVLQLTQKNWVKKIEKAISNGGACPIHIRPIPRTCTSGCQTRDTLNPGAHNENAPTPASLHPHAETVIIENVGEELDATLDPVLARAVYKKGACICIRDQSPIDRLTYTYTHNRATQPLINPPTQSDTGRQLYVRFGGEEVEFDPGFHLYLQVRPFVFDAIELF